MTATTTERRRQSFLAMGFVLAAVACGSDDPTGPSFPEDVEFAPELGIDLSQMTRLASGVYIQTLQEGEEPSVDAGSAVRLDFTLWLANGTVIQSAEFQFDMAVDAVIDGFRIGVTGQKTGEVRTIVIPSELAYGQSGTVGIPAHSVLVYRVEILEVGA